MKRLRNAPLVLLAAGFMGLLYAYSLSIPASLLTPLLAAALLEAALYLGSVSEQPRRWAEKHLAPFPLWMIASGVAPYLICTLPLGRFEWPAFGAVAGLAALLSLWYTVLPKSRAVDVPFVAVVAAGFLLNPFARWYPTPHPKLAMAILGQLMWTRLAILAVTSVAKMPVKGVGLFPNRNEWIVGLRNFALFIPVGVAAGWAMQFTRFRPQPADWRWPLVAVGIFAGMLWVVALREEFFFRGMLQEWLSRGMRSEWLGLIATSILFGAVHLPFRDFPNWKFAALATLAGLFYGRAYQEARSIKAAMVTHALVNVTWRTLFS